MSLLKRGLTDRSNLIKEGLIDKKDLIQIIQNFIIRECVETLSDDEVDAIYSIIAKRVRENLKSE